MRYAKPVAALISLAVLAGAMVAGIWRVGDAQCESARHYEVLAGYGYQVEIDPCSDAWVADWMQSAW